MISSGAYNLPGAPPWMVLIGKNVNSVGDDLRRPVSRLLYRTLVRDFTNLAVAATAIPGVQGWRSKCPGIWRPTWQPLEDIARRKFFVT